MYQTNCVHVNMRIHLTRLLLHPVNKHALLLLLSFVATVIVKLCQNKAFHDRRQHMRLVSNLINFADP